MKKLIYIVLSLSIVFTSCKTIDLDTKNNSEENLPKVDILEEDTQELVVEEKEEVVEQDDDVVTTYVVIDKPIYQEDEEVKVVGIDAVKESMKESIVDVSTFVGGNSIFDYSENVQFPIFTKKHAMTTIILGEDEAMIETQPFMSDTENWQVTGDVWKTDKWERQLIMVKPEISGLETNMLIVTNKRLYHFVLYSTLNDYQPMVSFKYKKSLPFVTKKVTAPKEEKKINEVVANGGKDILSFDYEVVIPLLQKKVLWIPETIYDDGSHTYIKLPDIVLQNELPTVYEEDSSLINYQVHPTNHSLIVLDKLISKATLKLGNEKITIRKKE